MHVSSVSLRGRGRDLALGLFLIALVSLAGCRREAPIDGIGGFKIGTTQLGQVSGRCIPDGKEMRCPGIASVGLGDQTANIDLYFGGNTTDATLVEILLEVSSCRPEGVEAYLTHRLGQPTGRKDKRVLWTNEYVHISAALPAEPLVCEINFVSAKDKKRIEIIEQ